MRPFDDDPVYPKPPYEGGKYLVDLHRPINWYVRRATEKGKSYSSCHIKEILPLIVEKVFDLTSDHSQLQEELDLALNLDCMINGEADFVKQELEHLVLGEVLAWFPNIAAELPDDMYWLTERLELIINVPERYEEQRGYFF
ncbi:hypothetical protein AVU38_gp009 [Ralstonia phage RSL2]|uniref:hypothetical protein n=1 Tax=Ralstonia phage RSL2 TaxID=1585840 RepID=UPI00054A847D|nr:hypothetical protein AVU38_gp009 [Ralstonia phage RSL2]